jgi:hypothetical protein
MQLPERAYRGRAEEWRQSLLLNLRRTVSTRIGMPLASKQRRTVD